jgi:alpha-galactosidase
VRSKVFTEHPDWLCLHDGEPWYCGSNWGGFYALDIDHPEVQAYLRETFRRVFDDWGFDLVKLDFLYGAAPFGNERETRAGRMRRAMKFLRELCGDKLILGCGVPVMPAFGLVDYCRISCDVGLDWDGSWLMRQTHRERVSTRQAIANTVFRRQLNGRAWLSDPDVFFLREDNLKLTEEEKLTLATVNALFGGVLFTSDNVAGYDRDKRAVYERLATLSRESFRRLAFEKHGLRITYTENGRETSVLIPM